MDLLTTYLIVMLPSLGDVLGIISLCLAITLVTLFVMKCFAASYPDDAAEKAYLIWFKALHKKTLTAIIILMSVVAVAIPSQGQWYTLIGGYYVTNIDGISDLPPNIVDAANKFLENYTPPE